MLIGYVSDEMFVAVPNVQLEFRRGETSIEARSCASGAVHVELEPGEWEVVLAKPGYGTKTTTAEVAPGSVHQFRLLSDRPYGYAWPKAVKAGDEAELRIHSAEPYTLGLYRYGETKQLVRDFGYYRAFAPGGDRQILPDGDFTVDGARWNEHGYSFPPDDRQRAVAPARTGLYYFHLRTESGSFISFPWVVAPERPTARLAVLASDITWNAYNDFGGRSNYVAVSNLPDAPTVNARQASPWFRDTGGRFWNGSDYEPLTFDRPEPLNVVEDGVEVTDPVARIGAEHVAPGEWRFLAWLEREGFPYDYYSETQFHRDELDLDAYEVVVLSTHPEYWSRQMYFTLKTWVFERGGKLVYLGGNGLNCEVEFADDGRAVVFLNEDISPWLPTEGVPIDWSQLGAPSRFGMRVEEESHLLGVRMTWPGIGTAAPYRVLEPEHWAFAGLDLLEGDLFGRESLDCRCPGGASGHETDKTSEHSPPGTKILARGTNPDDGGAEIVHFETASGGEVFSVGSISWNCSILVDAAVSRVTANALRRFLG